MLHYYINLHSSVTELSETKVVEVQEFELLITHEHQRNFNFHFKKENHGNLTSVVHNFNKNLSLCSEKSTMLL